MARLFDDGSSQYLGYASALAAAYPFTFSVWFYPDDSQVQVVAALVDSTSPNVWSCLLFSGSDYVSAQTKNGGTTGTATATATSSLNNWHHAAAVFASNTSRSAYADGGNKHTNTTSVTVGSYDHTELARIGDSSPSAYFSGSLAEFALYNVALTDAEVATLALGVSPLLVRPASLVAYWPLLRDEDQDRVGGYHMTPYNSPTVATHPTQIRPFWLRPWVQPAPGAAPPPTAARVLAMLGVG